MRELRQSDLDALNLPIGTLTPPVRAARDWKGLLVLGLILALAFGV